MHEYAKHNCLIDVIYFEENLQEKKLFTSWNRADK